ncbi:AbrB family transcriptional regulator [Nitrincola tibetensis]|uniref:AbrB family transcriptional regulator n=1 Tax=Nitrincola tibetensis TaxID=2219697 RepID=UPI00138FE06F|nr:AbrB family transcriptional regulator [Nitrincola tibetensis]
MKTLYTCVLGALGGYLAWWLNLPLPWMLGPLFLVTLLAIKGISVRVDRRVNRFFLGVLGFWLGTGFEASLLSEALHWYSSILLMVVSVAFTLVVNTWLFNRIAKLDLITSVFSSLPGTMNAVVIQGEQLGGDARWIAIAQTLRISLVVISTTLIFYFMPGQNLQGSSPEAGQVFDLIWLLLVPLGWWGARWLRIPMAEFLGPLMISAVLAVSGIDIDLPGWVMMMTFVVLGSSIGSRFFGTQVRELLKVSVYAVLATAIGMVIAAIMAAVTWTLTDIPLSHAFLALVPGGVGEMALIATVAGIDPIYVVFIHVFRMFVLILCTPLISHLLGRYTRETEP